MSYNDSMETYIPYDYKKELVAQLNKFPTQSTLMSGNTTVTTYIYQIAHEAFGLTFASVSGKTHLFLAKPVGISHKEALDWVKNEYEEALLTGLPEDKLYWYILLKNIPINFTGYTTNNGNASFYRLPERLSRTFTDSEIMPVVKEADTFVQAVLMLATGLSKEVIELMPIEWVKPLVKQEE